MSEVSICNRALGWLGANRITSLIDEQTEAVVCRESYAAARDYVLADHDWPFAIRRYKLPRLAVPPNFGFTNAFQLPEETIRVITLNERQHADTVTTQGIDWQVEGDTVVTSEGSANVRVVARITNTDLFSPGFVQCVSARLAADIAVGLTGSQQRETSMEQKYMMKLRDAKRQDGRQGKSKRLTSSWLNKARYAGGNGASGPTV